MEFSSFIFNGKKAGNSGEKPSKKIWKIKSEIDNTSNKITLITETGELGGRMVSHKKILSNIKLSSKKGISTLEKYAEEQAKKLFNNKKKEGFIEYKINSNNENEINDEIKNIEEENNIQKEPEQKIKKFG